MTHGGLRVGIVGATGAVGGEILRRLDHSRFDCEELIPFASPACAVPELEFRSKMCKVRDLDNGNVEACDVLFFAVPWAVAVEKAPAMMELGVPIIDMTGYCARERGAPLLVPGLNDEVLDAFPETRSVASPLPLTVILAHLLAPLRARCQDLSCRGTLMRAASARGRAGIEELSSQVVAMFNSRKGPRKVFSRGLAFDVEPICEEALDSNWAPGELSVARELGAILNLPDGNLAFTQVILPTFTGACLSLQIEGTSLRDAATCGDWLAGTRGLLLDSDPNADGPPRPRRADRKGGIQVGRLRDDPGGRGVHLWATSDEIVFGGAGNALSILRALLQRGYLEAPT